MITLPKRLDTAALYCENAKNTFYGGYINTNDAPYPTAPLFWLAHTALLPVTLTIGAGIKTGLDAMTRNELPEDELLNLEKQLTDMDNKQFDKVVNKIMTYNPKSITSNQLRIDLDAVEQDTKLRLCELKGKIQIEFERTISEKICQRLGPDANDLTININSHYPFTPAEQAENDYKIRIGSIPIYEIKRGNQQKLIIEYLHNNINAGTKMEHIIKEAIIEAQKE